MSPMPRQAQQSVHGSGVVSLTPHALRCAGQRRGYPGAPFSNGGLGFLARVEELCAVFVTFRLWKPDTKEFVHHSGAVKLHDHAVVRVGLVHCRIFVAMTLSRVIRNEAPFPLRDRIRSGQRSLHGAALAIASRIGQAIPIRLVALDGIRAARGFEAGVSGHRTSQFVASCCPIRIAGKSCSGRRCDPSYPRSRAALTWCCTPGSISSETPSSRSTHTSALHLGRSSRLDHAINLPWQHVAVLVECIWTKLPPECSGASVAKYSLAEGVPAVEAAGRRCGHPQRLMLTAERAGGADAPRWHGHATPPLCALGCARSNRPSSNSPSSRAQSFPSSPR